MSESDLEIDGYELLEALPSGASGAVYRARENRPGGVERAIKVFVPHPFADDQDPEKRFRSEADALRKLQHRAIVRYVHSGFLRARGAFYLVMEFVEGGRLRDRCAAMPFEIRVATMIEILDGLEHAHTSRVFHRDIKPTNIMIRDSDQQPVLVDFGLAYLLGDEADDDRTRSLLGTPGYIAPEAANDPKRSRDPRNDVFQASVTLYEILMGRLPGETPADLATVDTRLRDLDPIVRNALDRDPATRTATAKIFADSLREWVERDARRRLIVRSPITERIASGLSAKFRDAAIGQQALVTEQRAIRDTLGPVAMTVEVVAVEAFKELDDALAGVLPNITLEHQDPFALPGAEEEAAKQPLDLELASFAYSNIKRKISFVRARSNAQLWQLAKTQLRALSHKSVSPWPALLWVVSSEGSQAPPRIVWGAVAIEVVRTAPVELRLVGIRRNSDKRVPLDDDASVKEHILKCVADAFHVRF